MSNVFVVEGELSIYRAAELAQELTAWLQSLPAASEARMDLSAVTEIDSAGLQLVLSAQRSAQLHLHAFVIQAASAAVHEAWQLAALHAVCPLPSTP